MKILVTGASGFVGRYVCKNLAAARHQVIAVVRSGGVAIEGADVELIVPELKELDSISDILATCDAVIHLAGRAHVLNDDSLDPLKEFRKINVGLTASFALSAAQSGVKRFIFVSSIGVNGNFTKNKPFTEDDTEAPHDLYAISKLEAENALKHIAAEFDMQYVIVRPTLIFGPNAPGNFGLLLKLAERGIPLPFGALKAKRNLLSAWNFADFLRVCVEFPGHLEETFLIADQQSTNLNDIFRYLSEGMQKRQRLFWMPEALLAIVCRLVGKKQTFDKLNSELTVSTQRAITKLSWTPPFTTQDGLIKTGKLYREEKNETNF